MTATTFSDPIDVTHTIDLTTAAEALTSHVDTYGPYGTTDYPVWNTALEDVTAGNGICAITFNDRIFFIEYDRAVADVKAVVYGNNVILIETVV